MPNITPDEIREIRLSLGLTQVEAGELLGGGPRAFTKYESGTVKPAASVVNLLRLLEDDPSRVTALGGRTPRPINALGTSPHEVSGEHITVLNERELPLLLRKLLVAEAQTHGVPLEGIHVSSNVYTPDGGEDGRIEWSEGPDRTTCLPSRLCLFQLKSGAVSRGQTGKDVLDSNGEVKAPILQALWSGGNYIFICAHSYTQQEVESREAAILDAVRGAGVTVKDEQVDFKDAHQLATWVNCHPPVVAWLKERTQPGVMGPFRSWTHWAGRAEHDSSPLVGDERLPELRAWLLERLAAPGSVCRVVGLSGVGKSRLILEALGPTGTDTAEDVSVSDVVLYAAESEASFEQIIEAVQKHVDMGSRAVIVVDDCPVDSHRKLANIAARANSNVSLLTIDYEIPSGTLDDMTLRVGEAPSSVSQEIIGRLPGLSPEDRRRLEHFSKGFPRVAIQTAMAWRAQIPIAHATDNDLVDAFVLGRHPHDSGSLLSSAALFSAFGLVQAESGSTQPLSDEYDGAVGLSEIAGVETGVTVDALYEDAQDLLQRGVMQRRGRFRILQPRPIALRLAERRWRGWTPGKWDLVLGGTTSVNFKVLASRQLSLLNTTDTASQVVAHVCRPSGPFDGISGVAQPGHARVLSSLAEVDPAAVAELIERFFDELVDLHLIRGDLRRNLVFALEKIAFDPETFEQGAMLLLRLAVHENEPWGNNATNQFTGLFPVLLGNTAANGEGRWSVLDAAVKTDDQAQLKVVAEALTRGCQTDHFFQFGGAGAHGSRPNLEYWRPATDAEGRGYIEGCVRRLVEISKRDDGAGRLARTNLGGQLRGLVRGGFTSVVEDVISELSLFVTYWPEALEGLGDVIRYDGDVVPSQELDRLRNLIGILQPSDVESRLRLIVTEMSWDYPDDERLEWGELQVRQSEAIRQLASELLQAPETLSPHLGLLSRVQPRSIAGRFPQRRTFDFGSAMAEMSDSTHGWLKQIVSAVVAVPENERDFGLVTGYISWVAKNFPDTGRGLKDLVAETPALARSFPYLCLRTGIEPSDVALVKEALGSGHLRAGDLRCWAQGGELAKVPCNDVAPLFDAMLRHDEETYSVALDLMVMYVYRGKDKLEGLRPQIALAVEMATTWTPAENGTGGAAHFSELVGWLLEKGREDDDARAVALELGKMLGNIEGYGEHRFLEPLIPVLLSKFPDIVWPLISQAVLSDGVKEWLLGSMLRGNSLFDLTVNRPILSLPEDSLFAWCHAYPDGGPAFAAGILPTLESYNDEEQRWRLHPVMSRMIDEFGDRDDVWRAIGGNIHTFGWSGSATTYFEMYKEPFDSLRGHPKAKVRTWARRILRDLDSSREWAQDHDDEWTARAEL